MIEDLPIIIAPLEEALDNKNKEIERLNNIIKEVREYIEQNTEIRKATFYGLPDYEVFNGYSKELLKILDKENKND